MLLHTACFQLTPSFECLVVVSAAFAFGGGGGGGGSVGLFGADSPALPRAQVHARVLKLFLPVAMGAV